MTQLNAFVGHSFLEKDADVVRRFLDYFNSVNGVVPGFSWEHAQKAEPVVLAEKVKRLFEGKNLFIGICTSKEAVAPLDQLNPSFFSSNKMVVPKDSVEQKTSDWILQEIGFAVGQGMRLVLLVEKSVRTPGGLQGNIEYIPFRQDAPEKCFGQILEMIQAMLPDAPVIVAAATPDQSALDEEVEKPDEKSGGFPGPQGDWDRDKYEHVYLTAVASEDDSTANKISEAFRESKLAEQAEELAAWEAIEEYWQISFGKDGSLKKLEEVASKHQYNSEIQNYLGRAYIKYGKHDAAAECFEKAASHAENDTIRLNHYCSAARAMAHTNDRDGIDRLISEMKLLISNVNDGDSTVLSAIKEIAKVTSEDELWFGVSEALLNIRPDDTSSRFRIAYKYSDLGQRTLALAHYIRIPVKKRDDGAWNNLGAGFEHAKLPHKATVAYQNSEGLGGTLATSNLAYKLINAGYLEQAREMCIKALKKDDCDKNVSHSLSRIGDIPDEEDDSLNDLIDGIDDLAEFWLNYGKVVLEEDATNFDGTWQQQGPSYELSVTTDKNSFVAVGRYEVTSPGLLNALFPTTSGTSKPKVYEVRYKGRIIGRSVACDCTRELVEGSKSTPSLLAGDDVESWRCILYLNESDNVIRLCERPLEKNPQFSQWCRT